MVSFRRSRSKKAKRKRNQNNRYNKFRVQRSVKAMARNWVKKNGIAQRFKSKRGKLKNMNEGAKDKWIMNMAVTSRIAAMYREKYGTTKRRKRTRKKPKYRKGSRKRCESKRRYPAGHKMAGRCIPTGKGCGSKKRYTYGPKVGKCMPNLTAIDARRRRARKLANIDSDRRKKSNGSWKNSFKKKRATAYAAPAAVSSRRRRRKRSSRKSRRRATMDWM